MIDTNSRDRESVCEREGQNACYVVFLCERDSVNVTTGGGDDSVFVCKHLLDSALCVLERDRGSR